LALAGTSSSYDEVKFEGERGIEIYYRIWKPLGKIKALVVLVHGQGDHSGRYTHVAEHLTREGYALWAADLRGHGKSGGKRGHVDNFNDYLDDTGRVIGKAKEQNPELKTFLIGHSLGGLVALDYAEKHGSKLSGLVATAPLLRLKMQVPPWKAAVGRMLSGLTPTFSMKTGLDPNLLSHDQEIVRNYVNDPLVHGVASARFFTELLHAEEETIRDATKLTLPCLIMQGSGDGIVDPAATEDFFKGVASADKTLKIYEGLYHEVLNEPEKENILKEISAWLSART
jgi:alpha-beta hydrolase superfamily lysophospholipase